MNEYPLKVKLGDGTIMDVEMIGKTFLRDFWVVRNKNGNLLRVHLNQFIAQEPECPCEKCKSVQEPIKPIDKTD